MGNYVLQLVRFKLSLPLSLMLIINVPQIETSRFHQLTYRLSDVSEMIKADRCIYKKKIIKKETFLVSLIDR